MIVMVVNPIPHPSELPRIGTAYLQNLLNSSLPGLIIFFSPSLMILRPVNRAIHNTIAKRHDRVVPNAAPRSASGLPISPNIKTAFKAMFMRQVMIDITALSLTISIFFIKM